MNTKEEWEKRKSYLIRSLFDDSPISSIHESQEPTQSSSEGDIDRPESPLPDLIIEKELPRAQKYHQDESEEFYDKLAREMRRRYKRDFLNVETDSTTSLDTPNEISFESHTQLDRSIDDERSQDAEELDKVDDEDEDDFNSERSKEEETQKTMSTSSNNDTTDSEDFCSYELITTKAQVHASEEITDQSFSSDSETFQEEGIGLMENDSFANLIEANQNNVSLKSPQSLIFDLRDKSHSDEISNESHTQLDSSIDDERSQDAEELDTVDDEDEDEYYSEIIKEGETQKALSTSSNNDTTDSEDFCSYELIATKAQVHANEEITDQSFSSDSETFQEEGIGLMENDSFANLIEANQNNVSLKSPQSLIFDLRDKSHSDENLGMEIETTLSMERFVASGAERKLTPKSSKIRRLKIINKYTSRLVPYSPSSRGSSTQE